MGIHYAKNSLVDDVIDPEEPEVLVYMPNEHGRYKLVAVEFLSTATERPEIAGLVFEDGPFPGTRPPRVGVEAQPGRQVRGVQPRPQLPEVAGGM